MNKRLTYLFIFVLLVSFSKDAHAGTDVLCNVLTTINATLKEVGEVQNKISGKVRKILSMKVSPEGLLSSIGAGKLLSSAEKIKEKAENLKEKADRVMEFAENAKEKKAELLAQYKELNDLATAQFAQANEAFEKGKAIYAEYQDKYIALRNDIETGVDKGKELVQAGKASVDKLTNPKDEGDTVLGSQVAKSLGLEKVSSAIKGVKDNTHITPVDNTKSEVFETKLPDTTNISTGYQASAISSASRLADKVVADNEFAIEAPKVDILEKSEVNISTKDIMMGVSELKQQPEVNKDTIKTNLNLKDQLTGNVNKPLNIPEASRINKVDLPEQIKQNKELRVKFGEAKNANLNTIEKADIKLNKDTSIEMAPSVKAVNKSAKNNDIKKETVDVIKKYQAINSKVLKNKSVTKEIVNAK